MRARIITFCFVAVVVGLIVLWRFRDGKDEGRTPIEFYGKVLADSTNNGVVQSPNRSVAEPAIPEPTPESNPASWIEKRRKQTEEERQKGLNEWRTPIKFYGSVVDENEKPVNGVGIAFSCNDLSPEGTSSYQTITDQNGVFSLKNVTGKLLVVRISKDGYYLSKRDNNSFTYAGENVNFIPNPAVPIVFHLRKKGNAEPLAVCNINLRLPRDGTPTDVELIKCGKAGAGQGNIKVECWTQDQGKKRGEKYDWKCKVSIPGGGMLENTNEFAFLAPEGGYQESFEIVMAAALGQEWKKDVQRQLYFRLGNGMYGRMSFAMIAAGDHFCMIGALTNPSGSRNLEFDPAVQPKQTQFE